MDRSFFDGCAVGILFNAAWSWTFARLTRYFGPEARMARAMKREERRWAK